VECPEQRGSAGREYTRKVEGQHRLAHPLQEKRSFLASSLAVVLREEETRLRVFLNSEA
jgi:hypothetical protein